MRANTILMTALMAATLGSGTAIAQTGAAPQGGTQTAPSDNESTGTLSDRLQKSDGVIQPPDTGNGVVVPPPSGDAQTPVIRPPGTPGGAPGPEPK